MRPFHPVNPSKQEAQTPWIESRKFDPVKIYGDYIALDFIEVKEDTVWSYVACERCEPCQHCGARQGHDNCIVVAVDGACRGNGLPDARASIGVFFGQTNNYNLSLMLPGDIVTNQMAELSAVVHWGKFKKLRSWGLSEPK
jgi:ribonuclease HI